jgi:hypothetical protein
MKSRRQIELETEQGFESVLSGQTEAVRSAVRCKIIEHLDARLALRGDEFERAGPFNIELVAAVILQTLTENPS